MRHVAIIGVLAVLAACGSNGDALKQLQQSQRTIEAKLAQLEKKVDQLGGRPAAPVPAQIDPNKVYNVPTGNSPFKGPADAPVVLTEFSDFQ